MALLIAGTIVIPALLVPEPSAAQGTHQLRTDIYGDPLPDGVLARIGTTRFRHGGPAYFVGYTAGAKELFSVGGDGKVRVWELPTGKELRTWDITLVSWGWGREQSGLHLAYRKELELPRLLAPPGTGRSSPACGGTRWNCSTLLAARAGS